MWVVQVVTGAQGKQASVRSHQFELKREALAFIRANPHSFIGRRGHTYTIYPKAKK